MIFHSSPRHLSDSSAWQEILGSVQRVNGPWAEQCRKALCEFSGAHAAFLFPSGTFALAASLKVLAFDRVQVPSYACFALLTAPRMMGLPVEIVDIDPDTLAGQYDSSHPAVQVFPFGEAPSDGRSLLVDAASGLAKSSALVGELTILSFYATKVFGGSVGGAVLLKSAQYEEAFQDIRQYDKRSNDGFAFNANLSEADSFLACQAVKDADAILARRAELASRYRQVLKDFVHPFSAKHHQVNHRFLLKVPGKVDVLIESFRQRGVEVARPVWLPLHRYLDQESACPGADQAHDEVLSLPLHEQLNNEDQKHVIEVAQELLG